ncbi:hypothetical protein K466DRAFT_196137 [Polyporus arcularius HHB13444]|uniref:Uncharacterized protein n=1 Tax=Polyporus arcularius HHB13444 TaxID=1314778 RepID=A0A5C3PTI1_9APHY|nr:hypothetical protein K466DRAFT_196137 [Polyporus arcularius HHB13444]
MPKEKKDKSQLCCGELQRTMGYHKAKVHQQVTTVTFKCQPAVHLTITRNSETKSFHCPHCDRQYPLPVNLRDHMVLKCVGYAQHRAAPPLKIKIRPSKDVQPEKPVNDDAMLSDVVAVKEEKEDEVIITAVDAKTTQDPEATETFDASFSLQSLLYPESQADEPHAIAESEPMEVVPEPTSTTLQVGPELATISDQSSSAEAHADVELLPPVLRPATWSPSSTANRVPDQRLVTYSPSLVTSSSFCSTASLRSVSDDLSGPPLRLPVKTEFHYKLEPTSEDALPLVPRQPGHPLSAARTFLDGLRRPLGHAAPHLHGLGVVSEADLDLVCVMSEAWDEVGELLRGGGLSMIEWLMVKEAFKTRAKRLLVTS